MKKLSMILMAALLVSAVAGHAWAYFEQEYLLVQVIYNEDDIEVGVGLGLTTDIDWSATNLELAPAGTVPWDDFAVGVEDLRVGYFAGNNDIYHPWFATTKETLPEINTNQLSGFLSGNDSIRREYSYHELGGVVAEMTAGLLNSYDGTHNSDSNVPGYYSALNYDFVDGEALLEDLDSVGVGYVDMYLYHWDVITPNPGTDPSTDYTGVLRLYADGSTVLNPTVVPIPGAAILLGSGLLGLVGIRRRNT